MHRATSNKLAALGKYEGEEASGAAAESLFVANHSYWDYLTDTLLYTYLLKHSQKLKMQCLLPNVAGSLRKMFREEFSSSFSANSVKFCIMITKKISNFLEDCNFLTLIFQYLANLDKVSMDICQFSRNHTKFLYIFLRVQYLYQSERPLDQFFRPKSTRKHKGDHQRGHFQPKMVSLKIGWTKFLYIKIIYNFQ